MKTEADIRERIAELQDAYNHVLGPGNSVSTIAVNAPRALMQIEGSTRIAMLRWVLGEPVQPEDICDTSMEPNY